MPKYEYQCSDCHYEFARFVSVDHRHDAQACPGCGQVKVKKLFGNVNAITSMTSCEAADTSGPSACGGCQHGACGFH